MSFSRFFPNSLALLPFFCFHFKYHYCSSCSFPFYRWIEHKRIRSHDFNILLNILHRRCTKAKQKQKKWKIHVHRFSCMFFVMSSYFVHSFAHVYSAKLSICISFWYIFFLFVVECNKAQTNDKRANMCVNLSIHNAIVKAFASLVFVHNIWYK